MTGVRPVTHATTRTLQLDTADNHRALVTVVICQRLALTTEVVSPTVESSEQPRRYSAFTLAR